MKPLGEQKTSAAVWPWLGQPTFAAAAISMLQRNRWPATVLLSGPSHLGKATVARWLAQRDVCRQSTAPCGNCRDCQLVSADAHSDCLFIDAMVLTKREDVVARLERLHWKTTTDARRWRWVVITDVDRLNESIGNALLKLIEEPPERTNVVMTSSQPGLILPTIRSRAVAFQWHRVTRNEIEEFLTTRTPVLTATHRRAIASIANGRPGLAVTLSQRPEIISERWEVTTMLIRGLQTGRWPKRRDWTASDLDYAEILVRDALLLLQGIQPRTWSGEVTALASFISDMSTSRLLRLSHQLRERFTYLRQHVQPSFLLHDFSV